MAFHNTANDLEQSPEAGSGVTSGMTHVFLRHTA